MIGVDTNILVHAHREDSSWHEAAYSRVEAVAQGSASGCIPWPCVHEFLVVVTHPRIWFPPTPIDRAIDQVEAWFESPSLRIHDARIAALCLHHGVDELWTVDRDFHRFPRLRIRNPLV